MTNIFKVALVSLAVLAGATTANAGPSDTQGFNLDTYLEQQSRYGV